MKNYVLLVFALLATSMALAQSDISKEMEGLEVFSSDQVQMITEQPVLNKQKSIPEGGLLLIPESGQDRVLAFDPETGDLVDEFFITEDSLDFFSTPIQVLQNLDKTKLYVSDQVNDVVLEFDNNGTYQGIFAPAGGPNPSICDNVRGIDYKHGTDHILVCDGNNDAVVEFDGSGNYVGNFTPLGFVDPFDVVYWQANDQYLVNDISGGDDNDRVIVLDNAGNYLSDFANSLDFPEQTSIAPGGNILVATFTSPSGIYEYLPDGTLVGYYDVISSCRGVYELPNGNLLVTSGSGVYEISKTNTLVDTKYESSGNSFRFISFVAPPGTGINITFQVDMSLQSIAPEGVHIAGNFQGWNPGLTAMSTSGGNIYTYTEVFQPGDTLEYKFVNGDEWGEDESVPPECAFNNNRYLLVPEMDTVLMAVCYSSCEPCGIPAAVTFRVDMSEQSVSTNGVHLTGNFQGWNPGTTPMLDTGEDLYSVTVLISQGDSVEYKFINGNEWDDVEIVPQECGVDDGQGGYNRYLTIPEMDTTLLDVCFSSCDTCGLIPTEVDVTFRIDMSEQMVSPDGIHIAGDFQGWDPEGTELTNIGDDLYEVVVTLFSDAYHEYKFINGNTFDDKEIVPQECGVDDGLDGYNRYLTIPEMDTTLMDVCFSSCDTCSGGTGQNFESTKKQGIISMAPNPFTGNLNIKYFVAERSDVKISILNVYGVVVQKVNIKELDSGTYNYKPAIHNLSEGVYFCKLEIMSDKHIFTELKKIIKQ